MLSRGRKVARPNGKTFVLADKRINNIRGNRTLKEARLTLKIQPRIPPAKPFHESLKSRLKFPEWEFFVKSERVVASPEP